MRHAPGPCTTGAAPEGSPSKATSVRARKWLPSLGLRRVGDWQAGKGSWARILPQSGPLHPPLLLPPPDLLFLLVRVFLPQCTVGFDFGDIGPQEPPTYSPMGTSKPRRLQIAPELYWFTGVFLLRLEIDATVCHLFS